jgi:LemA protein
MPVGLLLLVGTLLLYGGVTYNRLVRLRNQVASAWSTIDVQLKRRCDLVPNLVAAVRGSMNHERGVLEHLTALRAQASAPGVSGSERLALDGQMAGLLRGLVARVEAYPDLKANQTVLLLQQTLNEVEDQVAAARRTYNAAATAHNTLTESVPSNAVAWLFHFAPRPLFEAAHADRAVPTVDVRS